MSTSEPSISIIIPSFNSGAYLPYTLESIALQDYSNVEVIIVDGGSADHTANVIEKYRDLVTIFISEKDEGQSDAVNKGFSHATGEFIVWQNADDVFFPGAFSSFSLELDLNDSYDVYFGDIALLDADGHELWRRYFTEVDRLIAKYHGLICNNQAAFIKRDIIRKHGFLDKTFHYAMDREFFLRLYLNGAKFKHFNSVIAGFRHQPDSKTENPENMVKWFNEETRIAEMFGLYPPKSVVENFLEKMASVDKAGRLLLADSSRFAETVKRKVDVILRRVVEHK
jgi:glycosyltransferase involved in cell wall biosynthesis